MRGWRRKGGRKGRGEHNSNFKATNYPASSVCVDHCGDMACILFLLKAELVMKAGTRKKLHCVCVAKVCNKVSQTGFGACLRSLFPEPKIIVAQYQMRLWQHLLTSSLSVSMHLGSYGGRKVSGEHICLQAWTCKRRRGAKKKSHFIAKKMERGKEKKAVMETEVWGSKGRRNREEMKRQCEWSSRTDTRKTKGRGRETNRGN